MKLPRILGLLIATAMICLVVAATAGAARNPSGSGQPNASCEEQPAAPPGFSSGGFANAEEHYAGEGVASGNANSSHAVSQYDVACFQVSQG
jgi:hypothetical protein